MSLPYNDTTTKKGIIQTMEDKAGFNDGDISGNVLRMKKWTARANNALDAAFGIIFKAGGTFQFDDSNHEKYNIIYFDIVSGQRDYSFTTDQQGNLILTIDKIFIKQTSTGPFKEVYPVDVAKEGARDSFTDGLNASGVPSEYDKTANGFMFDVVPDYDAEEGGMIYISREGSYFTTSDTTKMPGFAGIFHRYIAVHAVHDWGRLNLPSRKFEALEREKNQLEKDMEEWYGQREKDVTPVLQPRPLNPRTGRRG